MRRLLYTDKVKIIVCKPENMKKNIIKVGELRSVLSEEKVNGLSVTNKSKKESKKFGDEYFKSTKKKLSDYMSDIEKETDSKKMAPNKYDYDSSFEKTYHDEMEILNGQEMVQYDSNPDDRFKERALMAIEGDSKMGNSPDWANVIPKQLGFTGPDFGKNLAKRIKNSADKRNEEDPKFNLRGQNIKHSDKKYGNRPYAIEENNKNNKPKINETMKRLVFKKEFNGVGNALNLIPESYKIDNKVFEMTDGNENYRIRWEGSTQNGKAVILMASDKQLVNEDINRMKQLFNYKSQDTLGNLKGKERLNENKVFGTIWEKTKSLLNEEEEDVKTTEYKGYTIEKKKRGEHMYSAKSEDVGYLKADTMDGIKKMIDAEIKKMKAKNESYYMDEEEMIDEKMEMDEYYGHMNEAEEDDEDEDMDDEDDDNWGDDDEDEDYGDDEPSGVEKDLDIPAFDDEEDEVMAPKPINTPQEVPNFKIMRSPNTEDIYLKDSFGKLEKLTDPRLIKIAKDPSKTPDQKKIEIDRIKRGK
jgi:hypothetical protein